MRLQRRRAVSLVCGFEASGITPYPFRTGKPKTHPCTTTRGAQCLYLRKCTSDHCTCAIRDNNLEGYVMSTLHIAHLYVVVDCHHVHGTCKSHKLRLIPESNERPCGLLRLPLTVISI